MEPVGPGIPKDEVAGVHEDVSKHEVTGTHENGHTSEGVWTVTSETSSNQNEPVTPVDAGAGATSRASAPLADALAVAQPCRFANEDRPPSVDQSETSPPLSIWVSWESRKSEVTAAQLGNAIEMCAVAVIWPTCWTPPV